MMPKIKFYGVFERIHKEGLKTPKYALNKSVGEYTPMADLVGKDGKVNLYLKCSRDCGSKKRSAPELRLQVTKNSLNFTGLKFLFLDGGEISNLAYGNPLQTETFNRNGKPERNPFYEFRTDGFLFVMYYDETADSVNGRYIPCKIEMLVLDDVGTRIDNFCKQLEMGGFDEILSDFRNRTDR